MELTNEKRSVRFDEIFAPTLIYAAVFALCLYNNISGIMMPVFSVASIVYCFYVMGLWNVIVKKLSYFCAAVMVLLGISSCLTGNASIHLGNFAGIFLTLIFMLIHSFYDDSKWGFLKSVGAIFITGMDTIGALADPLYDLIAYLGNEKVKRHKNFMYVAFGVMIAIPLTIFAAALLMSADIVFNKMAMDIFGDINFGTIIGVLLVFGIGFMMAYCGFVSLSKRGVKEEVSQTRKFSAIIAIAALLAISVIYILFCYIQIAYLFIGKMTLPQGYTYAQYVHEGFYQLLFVCIMNLLIVLTAIHFFEKNKFLSILLAVISSCTGIMIASCGFRITMYVKVYGLSYQRILVYWTLLLIVVFLVGIVWQIIRKDFPLFRYEFVAFCILYLALGFMKPDYFIANYNLNVVRIASDCQIDYEYLNGLSSDAAPAIADYVEENAGRNEAGSVDGSDDNFSEYCRRMTANKKEGWRKFNFSRNYAKKRFSH